MDILNNINILQNEIQNAVAQNLAAAPLNPTKGQFYFDTGKNRLLYYDGTRWVSATDDNTTYTFAAGDANGQIKVSDSNGNTFNIDVKGLSAAAYKKVDTVISESPSSANLPTSAAVANAIAAALSASDAMRFKGTIGSGGTISALPTNGVLVGDTYKVATAGKYANQSAKVGDLFIATATDPTWVLVPSGDDGNAYKYTSANPALTSASNICTWTITHGLSTKYPLVQLYEISTGEMIIADIISVSASQVKVLINSAEDIAAGTYQAIIVG